MNENHRGASGTVPTPIRHQTDFAPPPAKRIVNHIQPGLLVLSLSGKILYANESAYRYLDGSQGADCVVLPAITELVDHMTTALVGRNTDAGLAQLEARRLIPRREANLLLQVFGVGRGAQSRVVVIIQVMAPPLHEENGKAVPSFLSAGR